MGVPTLTPLTPWSQPRDIHFADVDADGLMEQFVLAGETSQGIFIGAWHNLSMDVDVDSNIDLWAEGYSSSTISNIGVLTLSDTNDIIRDSLSPRIPTYPGLSDGYGVEMVNNMMSLSSNSNGTANLTDLGFAPRPGHTKDHHKNGTNCLPAWHAGTRVGVWQCSPTV